MKYWPLFMLISMLVLTAFLKSTMAQGGLSDAQVEDVLYRCLKQKLPGVERDFADHGRAFDPTSGRNFFYDKEKHAWKDGKTGESICYGSISKAMVEESE